MQFYTGCAQISVSGGSGSGWDPDLDIPGVFSESDSGYTANVSLPKFWNKKEAD